MSESQPRRRKRWTVRRLMGWIAVVAVLLALVRQPFLWMREALHYQTQYYEGERLIMSYKAHLPPGISQAEWDEGIEWPMMGWGPIVLTAGGIDRADLDAIAAWLAEKAQAASPSTAEGDLFELLDRLALARSRMGLPFYHDNRQVMAGSWYATAPSQNLVSDTLRRLGRPKDEPWSTLSRAAREGTPLERLASLRALSHLSRIEQSDQAAEVLIQALHDPQPYVVQEALDCLLFMGPLAVSAVPALAELAEGDDDWLREMATRVLRAIGPAAAPAKAVLLTLLRDPVYRVSVGAAEALAAMDLADDEALSLWTALLQPQSNVLDVAIDALAAMGPAAEPALPKLRQVAEDHEYGDARRLAATAIQSIEAAGRSADAGSP